MQRRKFLQNISLISAAAALPTVTHAETAKKKKSFTTAFISDIHIKPSEIAEAGMQKALQNINQLKQQPDFIINGGDSVMDALAADKEKTRALFVDMLERANKLSARPEFYNTILNTCTTNIVDHVNKISEKRIPFSLEILFPKNSDQKAYDLGLIDTELPFEEARKKFKVNERAEKYKNNLDFSVRIRN